MFKLCFRTKPAEERLTLREASVRKEADAYMRRNLSKTSREAIVNKVFYKYYTEKKPSYISSEVISTDPMLTVDEQSEFFAVDETVSLRSNSTDEFQLNIGDKEVTLVIADDACSVVRDETGDVVVSLAKLRSKQSVLDRIEEIESSKASSRTKRASISNYYAAICAMHGVDPLMKYPKGKFEHYKKLIKDVASEQVSLQA